MVPRYNFSKMIALVSKCMTHSAKVKPCHAVAKVRPHRIQPAEVAHSDPLSSSQSFRAIVSSISGRYHPTFCVYSNLQKIVLRHLPWSHRGQTLPFPAHPPGWKNGHSFFLHSSLNTHRIRDGRQQEFDNIELFTILQK